MNKLREVSRGITNINVPDDVRKRNDLTFRRTSIKLECFFSRLDTGRNPLFPPDPRMFDMSAFLVGSFAKSDGRTEADTK